MGKFSDIIIDVDCRYHAFTSLPDQHWYPHGCWKIYLNHLDRAWVTTVWLGVCRCWHMTQGWQNWTWASQVALFQLECHWLLQKRWVSTPKKNKIRLVCNLLVYDSWFIIYLFPQEQKIHERVGMCCWMPIPCRNAEEQFSLKCPDWWYNNCTVQECTFFKQGTVDVPNLVISIGYVYMSAMWLCVVPRMDT